MKGNDEVSRSRKQVSGKRKLNRTFQLSTFPFQLSTSDRIYTFAMKIVCYCYMRDGSEPLPGAVVSLYDGEEKLLARRKTDFTGRCAFLKLPPKEYRLRETAVPKRAALSERTHKIDGADGRKFIEIGFASGKSGNALPTPSLKPPLDPSSPPCARE